jgi:hypothetical protein
VIGPITRVISGVGSELLSPDVTALVSLLSIVVVIAFAAGPTPVWPFPPRRNCRRICPRRSGVAYSAS